MFIFERLNEVLNRTGFGKTTLYNRINEGLFPTSIPLNGRIVGWPSNEVDMILSATIAGNSIDEIKLLVKRIIEQRKYNQVNLGMPPHKILKHSNNYYQGGSINV